MWRWVKAMKFIPILTEAQFKRWHPKLKLVMVSLESMLYMYILMMVNFIIGSHIMLFLAYSHIRQEVGNGVKQ